MLAMPHRGRGRNRRLQRRRFTPTRTASAALLAAALRPPNRRATRRFGGLRTRWCGALAVLFACACVTCCTTGGAGSRSGSTLEGRAREGSIRVATFNCSLSRDSAGRLVRDLSSDSEQAASIAAIVQRVRPDVLVLQEFDRDPGYAAADLFRSHYLAVSQHGGKPIDYPHRFAPESNTGIPTGFDLDGDGRNDGPGDAHGFGRHPGHFAFVILSRFPIESGGVRSFRTLPWAAMPNHSMPTAFFPAEAIASIRLSSKNHVDVPIRLPDRRTLHLLVSHPTPPVFDGDEDRNGRRNRDEIRFWADYLDPDRAAWIVDDAGVPGGLVKNAPFVLCGDLNSDPLDGDSFERPIRLLLDHPRIDARFVPRSGGAVDAARRQAGANVNHLSPSDADTGDFRDDPGPGNLRLDYVLPAREFTVIGGGVFWPPPDDPDAALVEASDHRLVWLDLR